MVRGVLIPPHGFIEILSLPLHVGIPFAGRPLVRGVVRLVHVVGVGVGVGEREVMVVVVVVKEVGVVAAEGVGGVLLGVVVGVGVAACLTAQAADAGVGTVAVGALTLPTRRAAHKPVHRKMTTPFVENHLFFLGSNTPTV